MSVVPKDLPGLTPLPSQSPLPTFDIDDPATGRVVAAVPNGGRAEATAAVDRAHTAASTWRRVGPRERSEVLHRAWSLMRDDSARLSELISTENGKSMADARSEVTYAAEFLRWFAEESVRPHGTYGPSPSGDTRAIVTHRPVGVAALITPWNYPAAMVTRKVAPALAAGCTMVLKPAHETPLTALAIIDLLTEAGLPENVVNLVTTTDAPGVVTTWLEDTRVRKVSFTGSTAIGRLLLRQAADRVVNTSMELGGNAPFIVADDADLELAVEGAMLAKFRNGGQACTAANRFYVHTDVHDDFVALLGARVSSLGVGPATTGADIGPLISSRAVDDVNALVDSALTTGASLAYTAPLPDGLTGHFVAPAVITDVPRDAQIVRTEIFGPIAPIVRWRDDAEVLELANATEFGLASYVFSGDLQRALRLGEGLDTGMVGINRGLVSDPSAPFGGTRQSGVGREGAAQGFLEFTETQSLSLAWPD